MSSGLRCCAGHAGNSVEAMTADLTACQVPLLVLWDVDGTLIHNGGVSKEAYAAGFRQLTGQDTAVAVITDGQTDPAIIRSLLTRNGIEPTDELLARVPEVMPQPLAALAPRLRERGHAKPGAREAIAALSEQPAVVQSVLTGNIQPNAFIKTSAFGLHAGLDFEVGGYGSDSEVRAQLVDAARAKAAAKYGHTWCPDTTVLIGDTPRDVEAGLLGGAHVIAVATGEYDAEQLAAAGAGVVLADLRDTDAVVRAVLALREAQPAA
jgi:phosphoglycolate phosphatase-like HAD superfamily hydrolase